jgi:hypothetical protein
MQRKIKSHKSWGTVRPTQFPRSNKQGKQGSERQEARRMEREACRG